MFPSIDSGTEEIVASETAKNKKSSEKAVPPLEVVTLEKEESPPSQDTTVKKKETIPVQTGKHPTPRTSPWTLQLPW